MTDEGVQPDRVGTGVDAGTSRGHRLGPHTADCVIEAWAPDRLGCLTEALDALVASFARVPDPPVLRSLPIDVSADGDAELLLELLQEVIYVVDVLGVVPVRFHLVEVEGGVGGDMDVAPAADAELVGPVPKGVSWGGLAMGTAGGAWRARAVVDV